MYALLEHCYDVPAANAYSTLHCGGGGASLVPRPKVTLRVNHRYAKSVTFGSGNETTVERLINKTARRCIQKTPILHSRKLCSHLAPMQPTAPLNASLPSPLSSNMALLLCFWSKGVVRPTAHTLLFYHNQHRLSQWWLHRLSQCWLCSDWF